MSYESTWYGTLPGLGGEFCVTGIGCILSIATFIVLGALSAVVMAFVIFPNMLANSMSASICSSPMFEKGVASAGCFNTLISSFAAIVVLSA